MTFGPRLARLMEVRGLDANTLAERIAAERVVPERVVPERVTSERVTSERRAGGADEIRAVLLEGGDPEPELLRRLAPVLGLHRSDLFIIAGRPVPDDLSPWDGAARGGMDWLAWSLTYVPGAAERLHELIRSLPPAPRPPLRPAPPYERYPDDGAGALVVRLLHNRNLSWFGIAKHVFGLGGGPMLSASTIGSIGRGSKALTPELLSAMGALLDISAPDLTAVTGIEPSAPPNRPNVAALLWDARRLTAAQVEQVHARAKALRAEMSEPRA
ncbi:XRE family transcriptional regulator [Paractinoplanes durhamensis]|uniref:HTH cro/C1-type domain-containing protein n=1 Tax=Paractinoplanes durhamensis TaxID=113563 RepID=A0ABQ3ZAW9_9ACTN|nr:XRE family transcriptional regulator [Actinoplanes durhamensis]GIE06983.1 hypothetical protein Adu01nite_83330 [Actinoplanes durhamensis]